MYSGSIVSCFSDDGGNPMVAGFQENLDSEDEVESSNVVITVPSQDVILSSDEEDTKNHVIKSESEDVSQKIVSKKSNEQSDTKITLPEKDNSLTVDWVVKASNQVKSSQQAAEQVEHNQLSVDPATEPVSRISESPPSVVTDEKDDDDDDSVNQVAILQDEDISDSEITKKVDVPKNVVSQVLSFFIKPPERI